MFSCKETLRWHFNQITPQTAFKQKVAPCIYADQGFISAKIIFFKRELRQGIKNKKTHHIYIYIYIYIYKMQSSL